MTSDELRNDWASMAAIRVLDVFGTSPVPTSEVADVIRDAAADTIERLQKRVAELEDRTTGLDVKYGRDHSARITVGQLVAKFMVATDSDNFCDIFDAEFLFGCHKETFEGPENFYACKDVRGIVWHLVKRIRGDAELDSAEERT